MYRRLISRGMKVIQDSADANRVRGQIMASREGQLRERKRKYNLDYEVKEDHSLGERGSDMVVGCLSQLFVLVFYFSRLSFLCFCVQRCC